MKLFICVLSFLFISAEAEAQWQLKTTGLPQTWAAPLCIGATGMNTAIISARLSFQNSALFYTNDKGSNWNEILWPDQESEEVIDIFMSTSSEFYIGTSDGRILKSTDAGTNFVIQYSDTTKTNFINYIEFFDNLNGIAMGDAVSGNAPVFLKTSNAGEEWMSMCDQAIGPKSGDTWRRVDFVDENIGYFFPCCINPQLLYKSTDGGNSWQLTNLSQSVSLLKFNNENLGVVTNFSGMYLTTDGGNIWNTNSTISNALDIEFINDNRIFILKNNLFYSSNSGADWNEYEYGGAGYDMQVTEDECGWILAYSGKVYYNSNLDILTSVDIQTPLNIFDFKLKQNYPNPFNPTTNISFTIPVEGLVKLSVFDILGNQVQVLLSQIMSAGEHSFQLNSSNMSSGVYYCRLESGSYRQTIKMVLLK